MRGLKEQYQEMHKGDGVFSGHTMPRYADDIAEMILQYDARSVLDYGCGKAKGYTDEIYQKFNGVRPYLYDPYYEPFSIAPNEMFDGVICCDVLEHIPPEHMAETILNILAYAKKFVFFSISTKLAKKTLPDGRNAHLTVLPKEWWIGLIRYCAENSNLKIRMRFE